MKKLQDSELLFQLSEQITRAKSEYKYQPELTKRLDAHEGDFTETTLLEIVLWKVNRYPYLDNDLLTAINDLRTKYTEEKARSLLKTLLSKKYKGFDLPMASTVLRFACPDHLQIIDQRVYRFITQENKLKLPFNVDKKIDLYFEYIKTLKAACEKYGIDFKESDRILYQLDKIHNKSIPIHKSAMNDNED
jgi:thermostable 8-oxoguanine DNA glycosylase